MGRQGEGVDKERSPIGGNLRSELRRERLLPCPVPMPHAQCPMPHAPLMFNFQDLDALLPESV